MSLNIEKITIFTITLKHINITIVILYYILITYTLNSIKKNNYTPLILLITILIIHNQINIVDKNLKVIIIDVGQGDSILLKFPHSKANILIDTGGIINYTNKKTYSLAKNKIIPYLKSEGITKLDYLITTHGDFDHMGESINLVNNFKVEKVIFNCGEYNDLENKLISTLKTKNIKYYSCINELNIKKYKLQFLNTKNYTDENTNSNVIYLNYNNYKFLFMGDTSIQKEKDILKKYNLSNIDFLKVGHHGSNTSSSKKFINKVNPKYSLISVGKNNRYGHPKKEVLKTLSKSKIYRTDKDGSIKITIKPKVYNIKTCAP